MAPEVSPSVSPEVTSSPSIVPEVSQSQNPEGNSTPDVISNTQSPTSTLEGNMIIETDDLMGIAFVLGIGMIISELVILIVLRWKHTEY